MHIRLLLERLSSFWAKFARYRDREGLTFPTSSAEQIATPGRSLRRLRSGRLPEPEVGLLDPHAMHDNRELTGDRHARLLYADALGKLNAPRSQHRPPRSSPAVVLQLARRTGRQTSGTARGATGRRTAVGAKTRIIGRRVGIAGAMIRGRGRCRQGGAENDCGGQRDCYPARHFRISGLSCRGLAPNRLATAALSRLVKK
jgi:hypothetical protein